MQNATKETSKQTSARRGAKAAAAGAKCHVCGRPVEQRQGRGRTKEIHTTCTIVKSRLAELERLFSKMQFADAEHVGQLRGDLFQLRNVGLSPKSVTINPTSAEDI